MKKLLSALAAAVLNLSTACGFLYAENIIVEQEGNNWFATIGNEKYRCDIGKNGITHDKKEGDSCTPIGTFSLREVYVRPDKIDQKLCENIKLEVKKLSPNDGWCDEEKHEKYNQFVDLSQFDTTISHEKLWRDDNLYDIILVVGYNDNPVIGARGNERGKGSAIFIHIAREGFPGSAGCVRFSKEDLLKILPKLDKDSKLVVLESK